MTASIIPVLVRAHASDDVHLSNGASIIDCGDNIVHAAKVKILAPEKLMPKTAFLVAISQPIENHKQTYQLQDSQLRTCARDCWMMLYQRYLSGNKKYFLGTNMSGKFV
jgi:hypothetical protein